MSIINIRGGLVITQNDQREIIEPGEIVVQDDCLVYVGPVRSEGEREPADKVIEAPGHAVLPGFVNAHTHGAMTLMRGYADDMPLMPWLEQKIWPLEQHLTPEDVYWGTLLGAIEMLKAGVTTFNDMYWHAEQATQAALDSGIRACPSGVLIGFVPDPEGMLKQAKEFVARWQAEGRGRVHPMFGPHAPYTCPEALLKKITAAAVEYNVPLHIHLAETKKEVEDSLREHGQRPVEHLWALGVLEASVVAAHCVQVSEREIELLAETGTTVAHNPTSNLKLGSGFAPLPELITAGVTVGLGTDGAASNNNLDLLEEMRLTALLSKGRRLDPTLIPAQQALDLATRGGAAALFLDDQIGQLKPGLKADLILIDLRRPHLCPGHNVVSDLVYSAQAADVRTVLVNGVVVMENRELTLVDEKEVLRTVKERALALLERAKGR
ncbi:MAG TPA: amidohydrolase [Armatimonadetes bacterium]|nr:amidohydrolase [Armatimonadota bacterium]